MANCMGSLNRAPLEAVNSGALNNVKSIAAMFPSVFWYVSATRRTNGAGGVSATK